MGITWLSRANSQFRATWLMLASCARAISARHVSSAFVPMLSDGCVRRPDARGKYGDQCHIELTAGFEHAICFRCSSEQAVVDLISSERNARSCEVIGDVAPLVRIGICHADRACLAGLHRFDKAFSEHSHVEKGQRIMDIVEIDCPKAQPRTRTAKPPH